MELWNWREDGRAIGENGFAGKAAKEQGRKRYMVKLEFQVKESAGLLPEMAGRLVKEAIQCTSNVQIRKGEKSGDAKLIFHVLSLSAKACEKLELLVEGENEQEDAKRLEAFLTENF